MVSKIVKIFGKMYMLHFNEKDEDFVKSFLETMPTFDEFEEFCWSWKINYIIEEIENGLV